MADAGASNVSSPDVATMKLMTPTLDLTRPEYRVTRRYTPLTPSELPAFVPVSFSYYGVRQNPALAFVYVTWGPLRKWKPEGCHCEAGPAEEGPIWHHVFYSNYAHGIWEDSYYSTVPHNANDAIHIYDIIRLSPATIALEQQVKTLQAQLVEALQREDQVGDRVVLKDLQAE